MFRPGCVMLPNLRDVYCYDSHRDSMLEIIPYLPPNLRRFQLDTFARDLKKSPSLPALAILSSLPFKTPSIESLVVRGHARSMANKEPILPTFPCAFLHLSIFSCYTPIIPDAIRHLANLPNLREVSLFFSDEYAGGFSALGMSTTPFPSLRNLTIDGTTFLSGMEFIQGYLRLASLNSIEVCAEKAPSAGEIFQLFSVLPSHIHTQSLTNICVRHPDFSTYSRIGAALEFRDFEPLLSFANLQSMWIQIAASLERLSDTLLEAMSMAWPRIVGLHLDSFLVAATPSQCTFNGIQHLSKRCPKLTALSITLMASEQISWLSRPREGAVQHKLRVLNVGRSPIHDPAVVASFLSDIFPDLQSIISWSDYDRNVPEEVQYRERWRAVIDLHGHFAKLRREERA
jgi:hypothetical protein